MQSYIIEVRKKCQKCRSVSSVYNNLSWFLTCETFPVLTNGFWHSFFQVWGVMTIYKMKLLTAWKERKWSPCKWNEIWWIRLKIILCYLAKYPFYKEDGKSHVRSIHFGLGMEWRRGKAKWHNFPYSLELCLQGETLTSNCNLFFSNV